MHDAMTPVIPGAMRSIEPGNEIPGLVLRTIPE